MKKFVLIPNDKKDLDFRVTRAVIAKLSELGADIYIENKHADRGFSLCEYYRDFPAFCDAIIVIGGDGSMLDASVMSVRYDIPLLGVNLGKVGYLNEVEPDNLDCLVNLFSGEYNINEKMLLHLAVKTGEEIKECTRLAVNDVVISHENYLGIADFTIKSHDGGIRYRADGVIISTPQGSTAYSLSAKGPIVSHNVECMLLTPICPHSFFDRSIVFSPDEIVTVNNTGNDNLNISIDGRHFNKLYPTQECTIRVSNKKLKIISFKKNNMFSALFNKIRILEDI